MSITTGYVYMDTWYKDPLAINRKDNIIYADVKKDISPRAAMIAGIRHLQDTNIVEDYKQDDLYLGLFYEYAEKSLVTFRAGKSWFDFERTGRTTHIFWDAIIKQRYSTVTITYETGVRLIPDPLRNFRREDRYLATVSKDVERTSLTISGGLYEYREAEHQQLENTSYQLTGSVSHALSTKARIKLDLASERLRDNQEGTLTKRYLSGVRFEHIIEENLTLAFDYRYTNVYSTAISSESYDNNRFTVELRKGF
jgi:hypothetical protein